MSPVFATRGRAEEFEAVVEGQTTRGASTAAYDDLLELVGALRAVPSPTARADFVADLRARLIAEAAARPAQAPEVDRLRLGGRSTDPGRVRNPRERRLTVALGGLALVGATATMAVVAQSALPGDGLYPLKRGIEDAHAGLSVGEQRKGDVLLGSASTRLDELQQLAARGGGSAATLEDTMNDFTEQATTASDLLLTSYADHGDPATVVQVRTFTNSSMKSLAALQGHVPAAVTDEWVHAVTTLVRIDDSAKLSCPTCADTDLSAVTPQIPTVGTGFGTVELIDVPDLPDVLPTGIVLPSIGVSDLPPGSVTKPTPTAGGSTGPSGLPTSLPTGGPTGLPTGVPTSGLPTALPTGGVPTSALPSVLPTALPTTLPTTLPPVLPTVNPTQLLSQLTAGPSLPALPTVGVTDLLGGVASILPTAVTSPLGGLLP